MKLYYHHVGLKGAESDFPKTVYTRLPISSVEEWLAQPSILQNTELIAELKIQFPSGWLNCWGVPSGASSVIGSLNVGDAVLLLESTSGEGRIPVLAEVKAYRNVQLPILSQYLWGDNRFAYIFFFDTEYLDLDWQTFLEDVGYKPNYDPRGQFHSVAENRLAEKGGAQGYVQHLRSHYMKGQATTFPIAITSDIREVASAEQRYQVTTEQDPRKIFEAILAIPPQLTSDVEAVSVTRTLSPREADFQIFVKRIYGNRCAVCQRSRLSPSGAVEIQSAHIFPKQKKGSDDPRNGLGLCRLHHWAFDVGWFSIRDDLTIIVSSDLPNHPDYKFIRDFADRKISVPNDPLLQPIPLFLAAHRKLFGLE